MTEDAPPSQSRRVLMLTAAWPPVGRIGARRPLRLARRIGALGWAPIVLTPEPTCAYRSPPPHDPSLRAPEGVPVHRVPAVFPSVRLMRFARRSLGRVSPSAVDVVKSLTHRLLVPDQYPEWALAARRVARTVGEVDAVWVTGGPWGMFVVGAAVAHALEVPLVLDYRDRWTAGPQAGRATALSMRGLAAPRLERALVHRADGVAYVGDSIRDLNDARFGPHPCARIIPNGFDPLDLGDAVPTRFPAPTLLYAGNCYAHRRMQPILDAMSAAPDVQLEIYGQLEAEADAGAVPNVAAHDLVPAAEIAAHMRGADALLLLIGDTHGGALSGKLFDYLAAERPILVVGPPGCAAGELVERCGAGIAVETADRAGLEAALRRVGALPYAPDVEAIAPYSADLMAERTCALLDAVIAD